MSLKLVQFTAIEQQTPDKRAAADRRNDFREIFGEFEPARAAQQAARCSQCGIPFCQVHCPLHNNIPDWLKLTAEGRLEEAYELAASTNNFPEICGRICPHDRLCEGNCVIEKGFESVTIGAVEKYITETAFDKGWVRAAKPEVELDQSVGIIGGGPAGLAAAEQLRRKGYRIHVYDRYDRMGGLLIYGIPNFKLEKHVVERRTTLLEEAGVVYHTEFEVGRDASLDDLRERHDAVLIAVGAYKSREFGVPGVGLGNVIQLPLDYLIASNRKGLGDPVPAFDSGALDGRGRNVVVVGAGDTAMDCVRTAVRQGACSVRCLYRRDRPNMPGSRREVIHAEEEGVEFVFLATPEAFLGNGTVRQVRAARMRLTTADTSGRLAPEPVPGESFKLDAELVIAALGFDPEDLPAAFGRPDLEVTPSGTLRVDDKTKMTNLDGVFAAGDIIRGASLVVWAIRDARDAARSIDAYLRAKAERDVPPLARAS
ncbi:MAG: NAD(P)-dependent oxidoreductase [Alphaproteobacteria bacterium]